MMQIGIKGRSLVVPGQDVFDVLHCDLFFRHQTPGQVIAVGGEIGLRSGPGKGIRVQLLQDPPCAGCVIGMIRIIVASESIPGIEGFLRIHPQVQAVVLHECLQVRRADEVFRIAEIKEVDPQLVGDHGIGIIRKTTGHPVVSANGFQPPDVFAVAEADAVHFIGPILLQQGSQTQAAFLCGSDIRQDDGHKILLADAAFHQRIGSLDPGIGGDGLRGSHRHVRCIDPSRSPFPFILHGVGNTGIGHGIIRKFDGDFGNHRGIAPGLVLGKDRHEFLRGIASGSGVGVAGNQGASVGRSEFSDQQCGTGHSDTSLAHSDRSRAGRVRPLLPLI